MKFFGVQEYTVIKTKKISSKILKIIFIFLPVATQRKFCFMNKPKVKICIGSSCFSRGNAANVTVIENFLKEHNLSDEVDLELEGCLCLGRCSSGPIVAIDDKIYTLVTPKIFEEILKKTFLK